MKKKQKIKHVCSKNIEDHLTRHLKFISEQSKLIDFLKDQFYENFESSYYDDKNFEKSFDDVIDKYHDLFSMFLIDNTNIEDMNIGLTYVKKNSDEFKTVRITSELDESELSDVSHDFYSYMCHEYSKTYPISSHPELYDDREVKEFTKQLKELNKQYPYSSNPEVYKDVNKQYLSKL